MFYQFIVLIATILAHLGFRYKVTGKENIPKDGAFLLCANHIHALDPVIVAVFSPRRLHFMGKKELFKRPAVRVFFQSLGAFPVDRGATDMQAYRKTMELLKNGKGLLIFSQGTRMKDFENAKSGVAVFALKSGAPIVPVGIRGSYRFMSKIHIHIGEPISMEKYKGQKVKSELVDEVMNVVTERILALTKVDSK